MVILTEAQKKRLNRMKNALDKAIKNSSLPEHKDADPLKADKNAALSFVVWADPQISALSPLRALRVQHACRDFEGLNAEFDALLMAGDLAEYGSASEYAMLSYLLENVKSAFKNILAVGGNHDVRIRGFKKQIIRLRSFLLSFENGVPNPEDRYWFSTEIGGYKFILLGSDTNSFEGMRIKDEQLSFIKKELAGVDEGKPVFVLNHQPLKRTNGLPVTFLGRGKWRGSVGWESDKLREALSTHKNTVYITGHLHYCTSRYTYEDLGNIKAVNAPTVGVINHGPFKSYTQGLVFNVYDDKIIVRSRIFGEGEYASEGIENSEFEIIL